MTTAHELLHTTRPEYANNSGLMLEVKWEGAEHWTKLKSSEPYHRNKQLSVNEQIQQLTEHKDHWISHSTLKYRQACYRIGQYKYFPELNGYAWEDATGGA